jgi:hypothetical protein
MKELLVGTIVRGVLMLALGSMWFHASLVYFYWRAAPR